MLDEATNNGPSERTVHSQGCGSHIFVVKLCSREHSRSLFFLSLIHNHNEHNSCWIYFVAFCVCWLFVLTLQRNETRNDGCPCLRVCCRFIARIHLHIPFYFRTFMHHFIQLNQHHDRICHANRIFAGMRERKKFCTVYSGFAAHVAVAAVVVVR